jgi:adenosine deaminase/aminodeoxyfutalosine deaminase
MATSIPAESFAELHVHLEGAVDVELLTEIDPTLVREEAEDAFRYADFHGFLSAFKFVVMRMREPEHYRLAARALFARMAAQGIVYAEVIHSAGVNLWRKVDAGAIVEALTEEGRRAPLEVRWILDAVRQFGEQHVLETARLAADHAGEDVVGFGVGGDETGASVAELRPGYEWARAAGLRLTAHAGETSDARNVWGALELGAARIGHGIRAIQDESLVRELASREIPLEISLTSNVKTGAAPSYAEHPARRLWDAGVPIILNTDDPALFAVDLRGEFEVARRELGFSAEDLEKIRANGFRYAFAYRGH